MWRGIGLNILLFVPLGLLIGGKKGIAAGFVLSAGIEAAQYVFRLGYCEADDVLNNTLGAALGCAVHWMLRKAEVTWTTERGGQMYRFRKAAFYDILKLADAASILHACGKDMAERYDLHHWDNPYLKSFAIVCLGVLKNEVYLLYKDDTPAATFQIKARDGVLHFEKLGTHPAEAGKGLGSLCMKQIERIAAERGCRKVAMDVYEPSRHAVSFYEHKGYRTAGAVNTLKYRELKMEKEINKKKRG